ncbi:YjjG family noncanonical pyrimidine nucleotidase [Levilactobacillus bambusae]|uniref:Noncanonical pyrimidine nucleotidase, YjjG family n=1 Tax=Levilactobacillus bambusae TaxID=2024736 RepID=A0A2V1MYJ8_9LACO|nr:YjjG family noncanonical pyrimidine nucleotidase [Levilactobacillus bambusae]PWG00084.1 noncanonical pyrimidine nucleotidase, YjjG family [Levilactobacillus bambusae]
MSYRDLFFDLDDTILDFDMAEANALIRIFAEEHLPLTGDNYRTYQQLNQILWQKYQDNLISSEVVFNEGITKVFASLGLPHPEEDKEKFRTYLDGGHDLIPHAKETLEVLKPDHRLFAVTNGNPTTQRQRLTDSGLTNLFDGIFISGELGEQKPNPAFYEAVRMSVSDYNGSEALYIGDSLSADIVGAIRIGSDSAWFNPRHLPNRTVITPTYIFSDVRDLLTITGNYGAAD